MYSSSVVGVIVGGAAFNVQIVIFQLPIQETEAPPSSSKEEEEEEEEEVEDIDQYELTITVAEPEKVGKQNIIQVATGAWALIRDISHSKIVTKPI